MVIKSLSISVKIISFVSILIMLGSITTCIWVITGPRSLSSITPYVEEELSSISPDYDISIEESFIKWDGFQRAFTIDVTGVKVLNDTNEIVASFPKASFDFSILKFLRGQVLSSDLTLIKPNIYIDTSKKALYVSPDTNQELQKTLFYDLYNSLKSDGIALPLSSIRVQDANLFINNGSSEFIWNVKEGYTHIKTVSNKNIITMELNINFGKENTYLGTEISYSKNDTLNTKIEFKNLPSYILRDVFPNTVYLKDFNMRSSGSFNFHLSEELEISKLSFKINESSGDIGSSEYFEKNLNVKSLKATGKLSDDFSLLTFNNLEADLDGPSLVLSGTFKNHDVYPKISPEINADITLGNLKVDELNNYWPVGFGKKIRQWVTSNITGGLITTATGRFKIQPEDFLNIANWKKAVQKSRNISMPPPIPPEAIKASINIKDTNLHYNSNYPDIKNISGTVAFTGQSMIVESDAGTVIDSLISKTTVKMDNMWQRPVIINIAGEFDGKLQDSVSFLKASQKNNATNEILQSVYKSTGSTKGKITLSFPIKKGLKYNEMDLNISSQINEAIFPAFINGKDIATKSVDLLLNNNHLHIEGNAGINGRFLDIDYQKNINGDKDFDDKYTIKGLISAKDLLDLKIAEIPFIQNNFHIDVTVKQKRNTKIFNGLANISNSNISIPEIGFKKLSGEVGEVKFIAEKSSNNLLEINSFSIKGNNFSASGDMNIENSEVSSLNLKHIKFAGNDLEAQYKSAKTGFKLDIGGESLDLSDLAMNKFFRTADHGRKSLEIKADFKKVYMKNGIIIRDLTANANCSQKLCSSVNIYGKIANDNFIVMSIKPLGDRSSLMVESDNAGEIIRALDISKHIENGHLFIESTFTDDMNKAIAKGVIRIVDFKAIKTPLLGKLFTLASLKGIEDLLNNKGITFSKFEAPFNMSDGIITITDAKSSGSSVGLTSTGTIDTVAGQIDLKGAVVPAYEVNKAIGSIPLLGKLLIGKKNEGVIATKYRIKGPYEDAKITVNPFTILTPGFLRNIFDILP